MGNLGNPELRRLIKAADWEDLTPRLLAYANFRLNRREVTSGTHNKKPDEFVHRAVAEVLDGKHEYHGGSFFSFVAAVVDALIARDLHR